MLRNIKFKGTLGLETIELKLKASNSLAKDRLRIRHHIVSVMKQDYLLFFLFKNYFELTTHCITPTLEKIKTKNENEVVDKNSIVVFSETHGKRNGKMVHTRKWGTSTHKMVVHGRNYATNNH